MTLGSGKEGKATIWGKGSICLASCQTIVRELFLGWGEGLRILQVKNSLAGKYRQAMEHG